MVAALRRAADAVCVCDFTGALNLSQPTISHHLAKLRDAGLVESEERGIWVHYSLAAGLSTKTIELLDALVA